MNETTALVAILTGYWVTVFPVVRRELATWRARASRIADPGTRALALRTLDEEGGLAEGAAIFATLVHGRAARRELIRLLVAWQVAYDYLDTVGEVLAAGSPIDSADLYAPLGIALDPAAGYAGHAGDSSYLDSLVACCRVSVAALPSGGAVGPFAVRAAERCAAAQSITHLTGSTGPDQLRRWALKQPGTDGFLWWETAAGAISSLGVHALLATAALPRASASEAARIDAAYFPSICALSTLLDSTIDVDDDAGTTNHRCTDYYADADETSGRIVAVAGIAATAARSLPRGRGHAVILAGMAAYYAASGWTVNEQLHRDVASAVELASAPLLWTLRLRAWLRDAATRRLRRLGGMGAETAGTPTGAVAPARTHPPADGGFG